MSKGKKEVKSKPLGPFVPLGFVLKFDPPVIGLLYNPTEAKLKEKRKMYTIHLNNLIFLAEPEDIVEALFNEHPTYLDPNIIKPEQVFKLVLRLVAYRDHQLQGMGAFMTDGMEGEEYYEGEEGEEQEEEYTEEELIQLQQQQMMQQQMMKQQQMQMMQQGAGGGKGKKRAPQQEMDLNNRSF